MSVAATSPDTATPPPRKPAWKVTLKWTIALIVLGFVGWYLYDLYQTTDFGDELVFHWHWAAASGLAMVGLYGCILLSKRFLLEAFTKRRLPIKTMAAVTWVPLLGKFVPGKIASVVSATLVLKRVGVPAMVALSVFVLLDALPILVGFVLSGMLLLEPVVREKVPGAPLLFGVLFVLGLIALSPPVMRWGTATMLRVFKRPPLPHTPTLRDYGKPALCAVGQWMFNAVAVGLMCAAFAPAGEGPTLGDWPRLVGITAIAMCASYFGSFIVPQGVGVREVLFIPLLASVVPAPAAAAATLGLRVLHTVIELLLAGVGLLVLRGLLDQSAAEEPAETSESSSPLSPGAVT